jgi:hypothetical protein
MGVRFRLGLVTTASLLRAIVCHCPDFPDVVPMQTSRRTASLHTQILISIVTIIEEIPALLFINVMYLSSSSSHVPLFFLSPDPRLFPMINPCKPVDTRIVCLFFMKYRIISHQSSARRMRRDWARVPIRTPLCSFCSSYSTATTDLATS